MYLFLLMLLHVFIWLFVVFGGLYSEKIIMLNLYILLPFIYLIQILPFHIIVKKKIEYIKDNYETLKIHCNSPPELCEEEYIRTIPNLSKHMNIQMDKMLLYYAVYINNEDIVSRLYRKIKIKIDNWNSFQHPLSTQGLIIFAFIFNLYILKFYYKK
jgi:hypothetical protein